MRYLLIAISVFMGLLGLNFLTVATQGVGWVGIACLIAIFARMAQAGHHQQQLLEAIWAAMPAGQRSKAAPATP